MAGVRGPSNDEEVGTVPVYETITGNIISNPLEDSLVPQFLTNINMYIDRHLMPSTKQIQVLLFLAVNPKYYDPKGPCTPLELLSKVVLTYGPQALKTSLPLPLDTKTDWVAENSIERRTYSRMKACEQDGVFDLLWVPPPPADPVNKKRRRRGEEELEAEEAQKRIRQRVVSPDAWGLLEWLVDLWDADGRHGKDRGSHDEKDVVSSMFIAQLQSDPTLKVDNLTCPCAVIQSIYNTSTDHPDLFSALHPLISRLLSLVVPLVRSPSRFDLSSFTRAFLPLLRLSFSHLELFVPTFQAASDAALTAHLLTVLLESIGCTRRTREKLRRERADRKMNDGSARQEPDLLYHAGYGVLPPPSIAYLLHGLLPLLPPVPPVSPSKDQSSINRQLRRDKRKMGVLKVELVKSMISVVPPSTDTPWAMLESLGEGWMGEAKNAVDKQSGETLSWILDGIKAGLGKDTLQRAEANP